MLYISIDIPYTKDVDKFHTKKNCIEKGEITMKETKLQIAMKKNLNELASMEISELEEIKNLALEKANSKKLTKTIKADHQEFSETIDSIIKEKSEKVASSKAPSTEKKAPKKEKAPKTEKAPSTEKDALIQAIEILDQEKAQAQEKAPSTEKAPSKDKKKVQAQQTSTVTKALQVGQLLSLENEDVQSNYKVVDVNQYNALLRCIDKTYEMNVFCLPMSDYNKGIAPTKKDGILRIVLK